MDERLQRLQASLRRDQQAFNRASLGQTCDVLVERPGKLPGQWLGKSPWLQSVHFIGEAAIGDMVRVRLEEAGQVSIAGTMADGKLERRYNFDRSLFLCAPLTTIPLAARIAAPIFDDIV